MVLTQLDKVDQAKANNSLTATAPRMGDEAPPVSDISDISDISAIALTTFSKS